MRALAGLSTRQRMLVGGAAAAFVVVIVLAVFLVLSETNAASDQPIDFSHQKHAQAGISCQFCHAGVDKSPAAGIPSVEKCMGCHTHIATDSPEIQEVAEYWAEQKPIEWKRVHEQPSYVFFNHQAHIAADVSCGSCHGNVASMGVAEQVVNMNMGFCLDCHAEQDNKDELYDCVVCHR